MCKNKTIIQIKLKLSIWRFIFLKMFLADALTCPIIVDSNQNTALKLSCKQPCCRRFGCSGCHAVGGWVVPNIILIATAHFKFKWNGLKAKSNLRQADEWFFRETPPQQRVLMDQTKKSQLECVDLSHLNERFQCKSQLRVWIATCHQTLVHCNLFCDIAWHYRRYDLHWDSSNRSVCLKLFKIEIEASINILHQSWKEEK